MDSLRVLLASHDAFLSLSLSVMLQNLGHQVVGTTTSWIETSERNRLLMPDLIIMNIRIQDMDGLEALKKIMKTHSIPVIMVAESNSTEFIEAAAAAGASGCLIKPFSQEYLEPALALAHSLFRQIRTLKKEIADLQEILKNRKLIEQAKGLLMKRESLSEADAFRCIQSMSRNQNISMARISEAIILTAKLNPRQNHISRVNIQSIPEDCTTDSIS